MKFPYFLAPGQPRNASVPLIQIVYKNQLKKTTPILALVDSGASVSFAPIDFALWLGIKVDTKKSLELRGFNNQTTTCYPGLTTIEINGKDIKLPIYFGGGTDMQCILGQDPFFDLAKVLFERFDNSFSIDWIKSKSSHH